MSIGAAPIADAAIGYLPSRKVKANSPPTRRQYLAKTDAVVVPEARCTGREYDGHFDQWEISVLLRSSGSHRIPSGLS